MVDRKTKYYITDGTTKNYPEIINNKFIIQPWLYNGDIIIGRTNSIGNNLAIKNINYCQNYLLDYGSFIGRSSHNKLFYDNNENNWKLTVFLTTSNYLQWFWLPPDEVLNNHITGMTITFDSEKTNVNDLPPIYYSTGILNGNIQYSEYESNNIIKNTDNNRITINFLNSDINITNIITFDGEEMSYNNNYIGRKIKFNNSSQILSYLLDNNANAPHYRYQLYFAKNDIKNNNQNIFYIKNVTFNTDDSRFTSNYYNEDMQMELDAITTDINSIISQSDIGYLYNNVNSLIINKANLYLDEQAYSAGQFSTTLFKDTNEFNANVNSSNILYKLTGQVLEADNDGDDNDYQIFSTYFSPGKIHGVFNKRTLLNKNNKIILNQDWYSEIETSWANGTAINYFDYSRPIFISEKIIYGYAY